MRLALLALPALVVVPLFASCATSPAMRSPLREELASADRNQIEQATRTCFDKQGWKVDPLPALTEGAWRISAFKDKAQADIYIYPAETKPRITGGPDEGVDKFWSCLRHQLGDMDKEAPSAAPAESSSASAP
ncbi:MAG TPA: hypothetical protein VIF15_08180 [Polyangiaceae bacterium]|jgi:hypothetical protein